MLLPKMTESDSSKDLADPAREINTGQIHQKDFEEEQKRKFLVSLVVPAYNEASIIEQNLAILCEYMHSLEDDYDWEIVIVNDGSKDKTGAIAMKFAHDCPNIRVLHHPVNFGLGQALKYGFKNCHGDYIVVVDLDLSYSPEHIGDLLHRICQTRARVVVASPYMKGGKISNVPWLRRVLSVWANRFLSATAKGSLVTLTGMVRVYDAKFLKGLHLRSIGMEVNPEIIYKSRLLKARIEEIPAHLRWHPQPAKPVKRASSMKIMRHTWEIIISGFLFRPVMFFIIPSLLLFALSMYCNFYVLAHCWHNYQILALTNPFPDPTDAVALAFNKAPHTFFIGGMTMMLAIQLFSLGVLSMQSKNYFEEVFALGTSIYRSTQE